MTMCSYCGHDVPHPCPSDEHRQNCEWPDIPRPEPAFRAGDVVYVLREDPGIGLPRGSEVRVHSLAPAPHPELPGCYLTSPLRGGTFFYYLRDLSHNAPPVRDPLCRFCNNRTEAPCERARDANQCERSGILRVGRDANVFVDGAPGEAVPATLSLPQIQMVETDGHAPIRTTMGSVMGIVGLSDEERGAMIEERAALVTQEHDAQTAALERQRLDLNGQPALTIDWGAVVTERSFRTCAQCGEQVSRPCAELGDAMGCELPGRIYRERFARRAASREVVREMPPAVRWVARNTSVRAEEIVSAVDREEALARVPPVLPWCELCGSHAARPCTTMIAAGGCDMPRRFLDASGWHGGGVSARDFPPAVRTLCASIQLERSGVLPDHERAPVLPPAPAFAVRHQSGVLDLDSVTTSRHATMVTFMVARMGYDAAVLVNDHDTTRDAWNGSAAPEGFTVVPVRVGEDLERVERAERMPAEGSPWNVEVPPAPPPVYREPTQRRRAIRLLNGA